MGDEVGRRSGIHVERIGEATVVTVADELDMHTARHLRTELSRVNGDAPTVVLDLSDCEFLDSSGLHVLLTARKRLGETGHELRLAARHRSVLRLLELTAVDTLFRIYPSRTSALDGDAPDDGTVGA